LEDLVEDEIISWGLLSESVSYTAILFVARLESPEQRDEHPFSREGRRL